MGHAYRSYKGVQDAKGVNSPTLLIINLCDSRALRVMMSRSLVLAMFLLALPSLLTMMKSVSSATSLNMSEGNNANSFKILPILLHDLLDEGLIRKSDKGYIFASDSNSDAEDDFEFLKGAGVELLIGSDYHAQDDKKQVFDFVFTSSFNRIDAAVKDDGLVLTTLGHDPSSVLKFLAHYKIVYFRRFENSKTVVALRKVKEPSNNNLASSSAAKRVLCGVAHASSPEEKKRAALKRLEDVYLEPPRRAPHKASRNPKFASRKFKFLPNLLKDSLDEYPRRFFIADDSKAVEWFHAHYPTKDQEFEVRNLEATMMNDNVEKNKGAVSSWIKENVRREDYVVMKAEARVVEEMVKDKSLSLVDELFLECENKWSDGDESKRAYWQCLELYGKVKDQGIAVHQWWD